MLWRAAASALLLVCAVPLARAAQVEVKVSRDGRRFEVEAVASLRADTATAFATLTDYERLPLFVPDVREARILLRERTGGGLTPPGATASERLLIDERGAFRFWWFVQPVQVRLDVLHLNGDEVRASLAPMPAPVDGEAGRLESFSGRYRIEPMASENGAVMVRLRYDARFVPRFFVPLLIGTQAVRQSVSEQFAAMAHEIERRYAAR